MQTFLITFRESLEISVLLGVLFSLYQGKNFSAWKALLLGIFSGILLSILGAWSLTSLLHAVDGIIQDEVKLGLTAIALGIVLHVLFRIYRHDKKKLSGATNFIELSILVAATVAREGIEMVIFLMAIRDEIIAWMGIFGGILALGIGSFGYFFASKKVIKWSFKISSLLLGIFAVYLGVELLEGVMMLYRNIG